MAFKFKPPKPPKPPNKITNLPGFPKLGQTKEVDAHWRFNYKTRKYEWVKAHWRK